MNFLQTFFVAVFGAFSFAGFGFGLRQCLQKKNPFGLTPAFNIIGSFVWADAVIFGLFWGFVSIAVLIISSWTVFLLTLSIFWFVRSIGETVYWFNQQFAVRNRNPTHTLWVSKIFPGDSSWIAMQIFWQCVAVLTAITTLYLIKLWFN